MKIIVDTNVVFSILVNTRSQLADLLFNSGDTFTFYSCHLLREEIDRHYDKLIKISGLTSAQLRESQFHVYSALQFISEDQFPFAVWQAAIPLVREVDMDDIAFVALAEYLDGYLWTGDKQLANALRQRGYDRLLTTQDLVKRREKG